MFSWISSSTRWQIDANPLRNLFVVGWSGGKGGGLSLNLNLYMIYYVYRNYICWFCVLVAWLKQWLPIRVHLRPLRRRRQGQSHPVLPSQQLSCIYLSHIYIYTYNTTIRRIIITRVITMVDWNDTENIGMAPAQGWYSQIEKCKNKW